jgi:DNA modification methylase
MNSAVTEKTLYEVPLDGINECNAELTKRFEDRFLEDPRLKRSLVSFQANKKKPIYRWYKFKEAFSADLIKYLIDNYFISEGPILDPFAGVGTALFTASALGLDADGIELLPIAQEVVNARLLLESELTENDFSALNSWVKDVSWKESKQQTSFNELRITKNAYPPKTRTAIRKYIRAYSDADERVRSVLQFALLCVLESVSYTSKDGQYLRWDHRANRQRGSRKFEKKDILDFDEAITLKLKEILTDVKGTERLEYTSAAPGRGAINLYQGSCLKTLPSLPADTYSAIFTSPPYCNRYDYTRTYALELALLGLSEEELADLRQEMVSCTVENRVKDLISINPNWVGAIGNADGQELLQVILSYLEDQKGQGALNNNGIPRMVRGYFYEMACVIAECLRVLKPGSALFMVNDNVRYAGAMISVDLILSDIAAKLGFDVENILLVPNGKGNSSQQMGRHGREPLRKCVYVWRKPE